MIFGFAEVSGNVPYGLRTVLQESKNVTYGQANLVTLEQKRFLCIITDKHLF